MTANQDIKIRAIPQMDTALCDFMLDSPIVENGVFRFVSGHSQNKNSSLAKNLFEIEGLSEVTVIGSTITIRKSETASPWPMIGKKVGAAIRTALSSGEKVISEDLKIKSEHEKELFKKVQGIIANQINPAVASHGGFIELLDVIDFDIFIRMGGGCQGCASSAATLKQGVEGSLREAVPQLGAVIDTTDHSAGSNPFY